MKKSCPECGSDLVIRINSRANERFLGCEQWPECKHTQPLPLDIEMREAGAPVLPGFEPE